LPKISKTITRDCKVAEKIYRREKNVAGRYVEKVKYPAKI